MFSPVSMLRGAYFVRNRNVGFPEFVDELRGDVGPRDVSCYLHQQRFQRPLAALLSVEAGYVPFRRLIVIGDAKVLARCGEPVARDLFPVTLHKHAPPSPRLAVLIAINHARDISSSECGVRRILAVP